MYSEAPCKRFLPAAAAPPSPPPPGGLFEVPPFLGVRVWRVCVSCAMTILGVCVCVYT